MKYCQYCGAEADERAVVCVKCGCALTPFNEDVPSALWNAIAPVFPAIGMIIFAVNCGKYPRKAKSAAKCALVGIVIAIAIGVSMSM